MRCRSLKAGHPGDLQKSNRAAFQVGTALQGKSSFHIQVLCEKEKKEWWEGAGAVLHWHGGHPHF